MRKPYLHAIPLGPLQVVIVGKDPFPTKATQIPFCKETWGEQLAFNCSGRYVLGSLGVTLSNVESEYETPKHLFEALRGVGIVFLNASHRYIGGSIKKSEHMPFLTEAFAKNKPILQAAKTVIYCGEAWKVSWVEPIVRGEYSVHPDVRNKYNPHTRDRWKRFWSEGSLLKRLGLTIPSIR